MEFKQTTQEVFIDRARYMTIKELIKILIDNGVIIFGGCVRDMLIHDKYARDFYAEGFDQDTFHDEKSHPESKYRLLVPGDIDCFVHGDDITVAELYETLRTKGLDINVRKRKNFYFEDKNVNQHKVKVRIANMHKYGLPNIEIDMDVLFSDDVKLMPPFGRLDLMCNAFIMDKHGVRLSTQTGTYLDLQSPLGLKLVEMDILQKMFRIETETADMYPGDDNSMTQQSIRRRKIRVERILNMQQRGWEICTGVYSFQKNTMSNKCDCCKATTTSSNWLRLKCCGKFVHRICFPNYLGEEYDTKVTAVCSCGKELIF
jgi:hypothetical protein